MTTYISPAGNPEIWDEKPDGYFTPDEWDELHPAIEPPPLTIEEKKEAMLFAVDQNTDRLSAKYGFKFRDENFSLEPLARQNWGDIINSMNMMTGLLSQEQITQAEFMANFPVAIETIHKTPYELAGPGDVVAFWQAYLGAQRDPQNPLASGRILRARITAAQSIEELDAIVDDRQ